MFKRNPEVVLVIKTFVGGKYVGETAKVIEPGPDWFMRITLVIGVPLGLWIMTMQGAF